MQRTAMRYGTGPFTTAAEEGMPTTITAGMGSYLFFVTWLAIAVLCFLMATNRIKVK